MSFCAFDQLVTTLQTHPCNENSFSHREKPVFITGNPVFIAGIPLMKIGFAS